MNRVLVVICLFVVLSIPVSSYCETLLIDSITGYISDDIFGVLPEELKVYVDNSGVIHLVVDESTVYVGSDLKKDLLKALHKAQEWSTIAHGNSIRATKVLFDNHLQNPNNVIIMTFSSYTDVIYLALAIGSVGDQPDTVVFMESSIETIIYALESSEDKHNELLDAMNNADLLK